MAERSPARVSIVIPGFCQGRFLHATIASVFRQEYPDIEVIVVDDGSADGRFLVPEGSNGRLRRVSQPGIGLVDAINTGLRLASGEIITCLDPGNLHLPHTARHVVQAFARHPDADLVYGDFLLIDGDDIFVSGIKTIPFDHDILLYDDNFICRSASFYRRRLINEIGGFDNSLQFFADYEFLLRAAKRRVGFRLAREYLAAIRLPSQHDMPQDFPAFRAEKHAKIRMMYARKKVRCPSAMKLLGHIFRVKRLLRLICRGRLVFSNPPPVHPMKSIARPVQTRTSAIHFPLIEP